MSHSILHSVMGTASIMAIAIPLARAGGSEVYCLNGTEMTERWATSTVEFRVFGPNSRLPVNGYPDPLFCQTPTGGQPAINDSPMLQSVTRAAAAWTIDSPLNPGSAYSSISLQLAGLDPILGQRPVPGDGFNTISFKETGMDVIFGGAFTLAFTQGVRNDNTGFLVDVDMIINALGEILDTSGQSLGPGYSFVEFNTAYNQWFATTSADLGAGASFMPPLLGYADLQGVITHEFGHVLGFGHSLVDSDMSPTGSAFPTMFYLSQGEDPFDEFAEIYDGCTIVSTENVDAHTTLSFGILGRSARTPEWDDRVTVGSTYPGSDFATSYGSLSGTVSTFTGAAAGVHVIAIGASDPIGLRVGTLTRLDGSYRFDGLPPGSYYVYVEPVDIDFDLLSDSGFFPQSSIPEFLTSCVQVFSLPVFSPEYYDANEGQFELPMIASSVSISAATLTSGIDVIVRPQTGKLSVRDTAQAVFDPSNRGVILAPLQASDPVIEMRIEAPASATVGLFIANQRINALYQGQLIQLPISGAGFLASESAGPGSGTYDSVTGEYVFTATVSDGLAFQNIYAQGVILSGTGTPELTNMISVVVATP